MATTFTDADQAANTITDRMMRAYHMPLVTAGVSVTVLFANSDTDKPAVSHNGYPALAKIKINSLKDRVEGKADATMEIDEREWKEMSTQEQESLVDHELTHLVLKLDADGAVKLDDLDRPKIRIRKHDMVVGGFYEIVDRHKDAAHERQAVEGINEKMTQGTLAFSA